MTKYLQPGGFSVCTPGTEQYRDNWDAIFGKKEPDADCITTADGGCVADSCMHTRVTYVDEPKSEFVGVDRSAEAPPGSLVDQWSKEVVDAQKSLLADLSRRWWQDDRDPLELGAVQRRIRDWAEHNFPLKVTEEHKRIAREYYARQHLDSDNKLDTEALAYLLASREPRSYRMLLGAVEELGELCHAHLKNEQGIRGTPEKWREAKKDAIGDTLIYLLDYCNKEDLDVEECLQMALDEIATRDWVKYPLTGKPPEPPKPVCNGTLVHSEFYDCPACD